MKIQQQKLPNHDVNGQALPRSIFARDAKDIGLESCAQQPTEM